jgi:hypothetical protein
MLKLNIVCRCTHRVRCASLGFDNDGTSKKTRFPLENYDFFTFFSLLIRHNFVRHQTLFSKNYRSAHKTMTNKHYADVMKPTTLFLKHFGSPPGAMVCVVRRNIFWTEHSHRIEWGRKPAIKNIIRKC